MKKWLCALSICTVAGMGALGFAGCSNGEEVASIRIKTLPETSFIVGDVVTPTLKDGVFTIQYNNGRTSDLPLSAADLVYVDYNDGTTGNQFTQANRAQIVVVRYKTKSTTYNVNVVKSEMAIEYQKNYSAVYNGTQQRLNDSLSIALPDGVSITNIEYKLSGSEADFSSIPPVDAGVYNVRVTLNGGSKYNDAVLNDIEYTIKRADISFALDKTVTFGDIFMQYNDNIDPSKNWNVDDQGIPNILTNALKTQYQGIAAQIKYAYKSTASGAAENYTDLTQEGGEWTLKNLAPGAYKLRAYCGDLDNFNSFAYECNLDISARALKYGEDYELRIMQGTTTTAYVETDSLMNIQTQILTTDPTSVRVEVIFLNETVQNKLENTPVIYLNYSAPFAANWGGEGVTQITQYGDYKISISAKFAGNVCYFGSEPLGINVADPANPPVNPTPGEIPTIPTE